MLVNILSYGAIIFVILGAFLGYRRGRKKSLLRLLTVVASLALAYFISAPIAEGIDTAALTASVPQLAEALAAVPSLLPFALAIFRPLVFAALFFVFHVLSWIVYLILSHFVGYKRKQRWRPLLAALFGTVQGIIVATVLLTALLGYVTLADDAITAYSQAGGETVREESSYDLATLQEEQLAPVRKNVTLSLAAQYTKPLFESLSTAKINGKDVSLSTELPVLLKVYGEVSSLSATDTETYGDAEAKALRNLSGLLDESEFLPAITAELLSAASTKWKANEAFLGIEKPAVDADLDSLLTEMLNIFSASTADTVKDDFGTVTELFILMIDYDVLDLAETEKLFDKVIATNPETGKTFIKAASDLLGANPHFTSLRTAVMDLGAELVVSQFGTAEEIRASYEPMVTDIVSNLKAAEGGTDAEKIASITPTLRDELAAEGTVVPDEVVDEASRYLLAELESQGKNLSELTNEDIFAILDTLAADSAS